jgi:cyclophilin family peptidyl-prolyl cis-trans isomerase
VPKRKRRDQQHLRQESARRKSYTVGGMAPNEVYRPGFPMNMMGNLKLFSLIGVGIVVIMLVTAVLTTRNANNSAPDTTPTPTASATASATADASATASATPAAKTFPAAEKVIDAAKNDYTATVKTNKGDFTIKLYADKAPNTVNSFVFLAKNGFFDGLTFHRVLENFVIQTGDPKGDGSGGPGYNTNDEANQVRNTKGTIAMAKDGTNNFFGSQWFVNLKDNPSLDYDCATCSNKFYPFGEVTSGMEVVEAISKVPVNNPREGKPLEPVTISTITIDEKPR